MCAVVVVLDGQKIAKKVSSQISKESKLIRSCVEDYNACLMEEDSQPAIAVEEVLDPVTFESRLAVLGVWCQGTLPEKRDVMDSYLMLCRSKEELCMLMEEVQIMIIFYDKRKTSLQKSIANLSSGIETEYSRGISALLHVLMEDAASLSEQAQNALELMKREDEEDLYFSDSDSSDNDDII